MTSPTSNLTINAFLGETAAAVEQVLDEMLNSSKDPDAPLFDAMRYGALGGGKRLRAGLLRACAQAANAEDSAAIFSGAIVELVHAYSLIHDDLPAMDDDELRRGKPTCHIAFDEATAILAGDALLTLAFELAADSRVHADPEVRCAFSSELAIAAGGAGMVGGQMMDLVSENQESCDIDLVKKISRKKTAALIAFSCEAGAILGGRKGHEKRPLLKQFGVEIGVGFQIIDDLLDVCGDEQTIGKAVGMDEKRGKSTFVTVLGIDGAREEADRHFARAFAILDTMGEQADTLKQLTSVLQNRQF